MSKRQLFLLAVAVIVGAFLGFLVSNAGMAARTTATGAGRAVSKTVTITQFSCSASSYDFEVGNFCVVDKIPLAKSPVSMNCVAVATFASSDFTLSERCDPNGSLIGNPFFVAWKSGYLELFVEDGTYNFNPPRVVTYSATE